MKLLDKIVIPADLRSLPVEVLPQLAEELRAFLLQSLNQTGGHLAANLGTVELTIALHYLFQTPEDRLVWDVGHQAYPHKILTGRRHLMHTLKQKEGVSPFPRREESIYDTFGVGHSSTSISAALGMSIAQHHKKGSNRTVAIIGDGAMTAGMAFEALNHGGDLQGNLLVILNDNDMSISDNVGALSNYFARVLSGKLYTAMRSGSKKVLRRLPPMWELARRTETHLKGMIIPGTLFEELGFNYIGPIDGHDLNILIKTLKNIRDLKGPQFLHVITRKGKGYAPAEADPIAYHGVNKHFLIPSEPAKGIIPKQSSPPTYSQVFGEWICDMAKVEPRLIGITPAMKEGSDLIRFSKEFPDRYYDVGIAEQHAVTFAAGLACEQLKPVVAIYSTFLQRAYDQLLHDVALQNLPVLFALDRAGLVPDGPTHSGCFDLSFLRCIPNICIMTPSDEQECRQMLSTGLYIDGPACVRYPRRQGVGVPMTTTLETLALGKGEIRRQGQNILLLCFGTLLHTALSVAETLNATVVNMRFVKPLDVPLVLSLAAEHTLLVTIEENSIMGGAGSAVCEALLQAHCSIPTLQLGIPDYFIEHASQEEMLASCGLDAGGILASIQNFWAGLKEHSLKNTVE